jgi:hypothetical protein
MTNRLCVSLIAAAIAFSFAAPAFAAPADDQAQLVTKKTAKKTVHHKRHSRNVSVYRPAYPALEPYRSFGFVGDFPGACAYDRAAGRCMIDLGYGRCVPCDIGGGGGRF